MVKKISNAEFQSEVLNGKGVALVDLFADWCMPCQMIAPIIEEISNEKTDVKFFKVNVDENRELSKKYKLKGEKNAKCIMANFYNNINCLCNFFG